VIAGLPDGGPTFEAVTGVLRLVVAPSIPIATVLAIFRYRLYDINCFLNRTLVYAALTGVLVAGYVGGVVLLQTLFRSLTGGESTLAVVASTLTIAALFNPLRRAIQTFIDRRFYRNRYDAAKTLEAFSATLRDEPISISWAMPRWRSCERPCSLPTLRCGCGGSPTARWAGGRREDASAGRRWATGTLACGGAGRLVDGLAAGAGVRR
jgi:hypothetical protein